MPFALQLAHDLAHRPRAVDELVAERTQFGDVVAAEEHHTQTSAARSLQEQMRPRVEFASDAHLSDRLPVRTQFPPYRSRGSATVGGTGPGVDQRQGAVVV